MSYIGSTGGIRDSYSRGCATGILEYLYNTKGGGYLHTKEKSWIRVCCPERYQVREERAMQKKPNNRACCTVGYAKVVSAGEGHNYIRALDLGMLH